MRCLSLELSSCAVRYSIRPGLRAKQSRDPETGFSVTLYAPLSLRLLSQWGLGGGVVVLEPAGLGLLLGGEVGASSSLSLSLQGGAGGEDDSERERFLRYLFTKAGRRGARGGGGKQGWLRETHLTRTISLTSEPSFNHVL